MPLPSPTPRGSGEHVVPAHSSGRNDPLLFLKKGRTPINQPPGRVNKVMTCKVMACTVMAYKVMAYKVMAYKVMAYADMACIGLAYLVMAYLYRYGLCSNGI